MNNDNSTATRADKSRPVSTSAAASHQMAGQPVARARSAAASVVFDVLDPVPYGFLVGAFIFDAIYDRSGEVLWVKAAAWLIALGLLFAVLPRLINLARVWFAGDRLRADGEMAAFWLNLLAIGSAIVNAFVHSRDAYGVMPEGLWLSSLTVILLVLAKVASALQQTKARVRS